MVLLCSLFCFVWQPHYLFTHLPHKKRNHTALEQHKSERLFFWGEIRRISKPFFFGWKYQKTLKKFEPTLNRLSFFLFFFWSINLICTNGALIRWFESDAEWKAWRSNPPTLSRPRGMWWRRGLTHDPDWAKQRLDCARLFNVFELSPCIDFFFFFFQYAVFLSESKYWAWRMIGRGLIWFHIRGWIELLII